MYVFFFVTIALQVFAGLYASNWIHLPLTPFYNITTMQRVLDEKVSTSRLTRSQAEGWLCENVGVLSQKQVLFCKDNFPLMHFIAYGLALGYHECRNQFKFERWNCTMMYIPGQDIMDTKLQLGTVTSAGTKETAVLYSMLSAGMLHDITYGCQKGQIPNCRCNDIDAYSVNRDSPTAEVDRRFGRSGCFDGAPETAYNMIKRFLAPYFHDLFRQSKPVLGNTSENEVRGDARHLVNYHNVNLGRSYFKKKIMKLECRCHGTSTSCALKTCWQSLKSANMTKIGGWIKYKYSKNPVHVKKKTRGYLRSTGSHRRQIRKTQMVYINNSPDYCERNDALGIYGTEGRSCGNHTINSLDCEMLCCDQPRTLKTRNETWQCDARLVYKIGVQPYIQTNPCNVTVKWAVCDRHARMTHVV